MSAQGQKKLPLHEGCQLRPDSGAAEALLMFSSRLESTAEQFSKSDFQSIRGKSQGMKLLAEEVRQEIDKRISI